MAAGITRAPACAPRLPGRRQCPQIHIPVLIWPLPSAQGENALERAQGRIVVDGHGDHLAIQDVREHVAARDDLNLLPVSVNALMRLHCRRGRLRRGANFLEVAPGSNFTMPPGRLTIPRPWPCS